MICDESVSDNRVENTTVTDISGSSTSRTEVSLSTGVDQGIRDFRDYTNKIGFEINVSESHDRDLKEEKANNDSTDEPWEKEALPITPPTTPKKTKKTKNVVSKKFKESVSSFTDTEDRELDDFDEDVSLDLHEVELPSTPTKEIKKIGTIACRDIRHQPHYQALVAAEDARKEALRKQKEEEKKQQQEINDFNWKTGTDLWTSNKKALNQRSRNNNSANSHKSNVSNNNSNWQKSNIIQTLLNPNAARFTPNSLKEASKTKSQNTSRTSSPARFPSPKPELGPRFTRVHNGSSGQNDDKENLSPLVKPIEKISRETADSNVSDQKIFAGNAIGTLGSTNPKSKGFRMILSLSMSDTEPQGDIYYCYSNKAMNKKSTEFPLSKSRNIIYMNATEQRREPWIKTTDNLPLTYKHHNLNRMSFQFPNEPFKNSWISYNYKPEEIGDFPDAKSVRGNLKWVYKKRKPVIGKWVADKKTICFEGEITGLHQEKNLELKSASTILSDICKSTMVSVNPSGEGKCTFFIYRGPLEKQIKNLNKYNDYVYKPLFEPKIGETYLFMKHRCEYLKNFMLCSIIGTTKSKSKDKPKK